MNSENMEMEKLGFSDCMGPKLRELVERQLLNDLNNYLTPETIAELTEAQFDWSDSCIEGHRTYWLDGDIENFSGIAIYDQMKNLIVEGWMEFIETETGILVFWWFLSGPALKTQPKASNRVPRHIWGRLSNEERCRWIEYASTKKINISTQCL
ncbi:hypothetical protein HBA92_21185 [Ochrobactrum sp. MR28]|nr:hypothetical protein [Ochrobactrum sp. MR28]MBX8818800.1 hypothetical protein [Ochrobactrum sp. MR31]